MINRIAVVLQPHFMSNASSHHVISLNLFLFLIDLPITELNEEFNVGIEALQ